MLRKTGFPCAFIHQLFKILQWMSKKTYFIEIVVRNKLPIKFHLNLLYLTLLEFLKEFSDLPSVFWFKQFSSFWFNVWCFNDKTNKQSFDSKTKIILPMINEFNRTSVVMSFSTSPFLSNLLTDGASSNMMFISVRILTILEQK